MFSVNIYICIQNFVCVLWMIQGIGKKENSKSYFYHNPRWGKCNSCWSPFPLEQCWVLQAKHLLQDLNFVGGGGWGLGENLVKAVFISVYCRLTANSIQKTRKKGRYPKTQPFGQDCRCWKWWVHCSVQFCWPYHEWFLKYRDRPPLTEEVSVLCKSKGYR